MLKRHLELGEDLELVINQNTSSGELGATVWDSALSLVNSFAHAPQVWKLEGSILDLSAGTGVCGIAAGRVFKGAVGRIVFSDLPPLIALIRENVEENGLVASDDTVMAFEWGDNPCALKPPFDVILLSDCIVKSYSDNYPLLLTSLSELSHDATRIFVAMELRSVEDKNFFEMLPIFGFSCERVTAGVHPGFECDEIRIFELGKTYHGQNCLY